MNHLANPGRFICLRKISVFLFLLQILMGGTVTSSAAPTERRARDLPPIKAGRIDQIASWLGDRPVFFCPTFDDRAFWTRLAAQPGAEEVMKAVA